MIIDNTTGGSRANSLITLATSSSHNNIFNNNLSMYQIGNTITPNAAAIKLATSDFNFIHHNRIFVNFSNGTTFGIWLESGSNNNTLWNNNITIRSGPRTSISPSIWDGINSSSGRPDILVYNNSFGQIKWTGGNLTTYMDLNLSLLSVNITNNSLGMDNTINILTLNKSGDLIIDLTFYNLPHIGTPTVKKDGLTCTTPVCTALNYAGGTFSLRVNSFSIYTTEEADSPRVIFNSPANNSNYTSLSNIILNVTATDTSSVSTVYFNISNGTVPILVKASNFAGNYYNYTFNLAGLIQSTHVITAIANDTLNNINDTETRVITLDITKPSVVNITSTKYILSSNTTITLTVNTTDNVKINSVKIGNKTTQSMSLLFGTTYNLTTTPTNLGCYASTNCTIRVNSSDGIGNNNDTQTLQLSLDNILPTNLLYVSPTYAEGTNLSQTWYTINVTFTELNSAYCMIEDKTVGGNYTVTPNGTTCYANLTGLSNAKHTYRILLNDTVGNINVTAYRNVTLDTGAPYTMTNTVLYPAGQNRAATSQTIVFNTTFFDSYTRVDTILLNASTIGCNELKLENDINEYYSVDCLIENIANGTYTLNFTANDTLNNVVRTITTSVRIDGSPPGVTANNPLANTYQGALITINATVTDDANLTNVYYRYENLTTNSSWTAMSQKQNNLWDSSLNTSSLNKNINYTIRINASDGSKQYNTTTIMNNITIDRDGPTIVDFIEPYTSSGNHSFNFAYANISTSDAGGINIIDILIYNTTGLYSRLLSSIDVSYFYANFTNIPDGTYYINSSVNDTFNNMNHTTSSLIIGIDSTIPLINFTLPHTISGNYSSNIIFINIFH